MRQRVVTAIPAVLAAGLFAACSKDSKGPLEVVPLAKVQVTIVRSGGVTGSPVAGTIQVDSGSAVTYSFQAETGYQDLKVYLNGTAAPTSGSLTAVNHESILSATALPVPQEGLPGSELANALYMGSDPLSAFEEVLGALRSAFFEGDSTQLVRLDQARYAILLEKGPAANEHLSRALAGHTFVLLGGEDIGSYTLGNSPVRRLRTDRASSFDAESDDVLFKDNGFAPTTFVFVNGILNWEGGATQNARETAAVLRDAGFHTPSFLRDIFAPRPQSSVRFLLHFNKIITDNPDAAVCLKLANWAIETAQRADPDASEAVLAATAQSLYEKWLDREPYEGTCNDGISTNARVFGSWYNSTLDQLGELSFQDEQLLAVIESERKMEGGRNVILIGHSQGTSIVHDVMGRATEPKADQGCYGIISVASPMSSQVEFAHSKATFRVIALGEHPDSHDLLYSLGTTNAQSRNDGAESSLTQHYDALYREQDKARFETHWPRLRDQLRLHGYATTYLSPAGYRRVITDALAEEYHALASSCGGTLSGAVLDIATRKPIEGARVEAIRMDTVRSSVTTAADGTFQTGTLYPTLHDVRVTAEGFEGTTLPQRLVPFNTSGRVQGSAIYLARPCDRSAPCELNGVYDGYYQLSGTRGGQPTNCAFHAMITAWPTSDSTFEGTVTTAEEQRGCEVDNHYVHWGQGTLAISGTNERGKLVMEHPAEPPWTLNGRVSPGGFAAVESSWRPEGDFALRVELVGTRIADVPFDTHSGGRRTTNRVSGPAPSVK
jgi:hypothetical protein